MAIDSEEHDLSSAIDVFRGDNGAIVVNASGIDLGPISDAVAGTGPGRENGQIMAAMASWVGKTNPPAHRRVNGIFDRNRFVTPNSPHELMRVARLALGDDIIGTAADLTEALALNASSIRSPEDLDQESVWNQIAADLDLDSRLREMWRVMFTDSQVVVAAWWGVKEYKSKRKTEQGQAPRKAYNLTVPMHLTMLDTTKVTPIGSLMFNQERLAFIATPEEADFLDQVLAARDGVTPPPPGQYSSTQVDTVRFDDAGRRMVAPTVRESGMSMVDPIVARLITSRYVPDRIELQQLMDDGVDPTHLYAFDPRYVWRHTETRPQFLRFAEVRMKKVLALLDLKEQLRAMDRAHLIGGANYIVLITKGSDLLPAQQSEINNLQAHVRTIGQIPVMVGDHRLDVKIVTPTMDTTLNQERHDTIDVRISAAVYGMFAATGADTSDPVKSGQVISRGLESKRRMLRRAIEARVFQIIRDANPDVLTSRAKLVYHPGTISLAFDSSWATFLLDLREAREISRETMLSQMDLDQADEHAQILREADEYDDDFKSFVPHGANPGQTQDDAGDTGDTGQPMTRSERRRAGRRQGGNRNGGGAAPGTRQGQSTADPRRSDTGPTKRPRARAIEALTAAGVAIDGELTVDDIVEELHHLERSAVIAAATVYEIPNRHRMKRGDTLERLTAAILQDTEDPDA